MAIFMFYIGVFSIVFTIGGGIAAVLEHYIW